MSNHFMHQELARLRVQEKLKEGKTAQLLASKRADTKTELESTRIIPIKETILSALRRFRFGEDLTSGG